MRFAIAGSNLYDLERPTGPIHGDPNQWGAAEKKSRKLLVSRDCPADVALEVFLHEYRHAWDNHTPRPSTMEEECDLFAAMVQALMKDLAKQGGLMALLSADAGEVSTDKPLAVGGAISPIDKRENRCDQCRTGVTPSSVVLVPIEKHPRVGAPAVEITFYCEFCDHLIRWPELTNLNGIPSGIAIEPPVYIRGKECTEWCKAHPKESGIIIR